MSRAMIIELRASGSRLMRPGRRDGSMPAGLCFRDCLPIWKAACPGRMGTSSQIKRKYPAFVLALAVRMVPHMS